MKGSLGADGTFPSRSLPPKRVSPRRKNPPLPPQTEEPALTSARERVVCERTTSTVRILYSCRGPSRARAAGTTVDLRRLCGRARSHRQWWPPSRALVRLNAHTSHLDLGAMYASTSRTTNGTATRPSTTTPRRQRRTGLKRVAGVARNPVLRCRSSQANRPQWRLVSPPTGHAARQRPPVPGWRR